MDMKSKIYLALMLLLAASAVRASDGDMTGETDEPYVVDDSDAGSRQRIDAAYARIQKETKVMTEARRKADALRKDFEKALADAQAADPGAAEVNHKFAAALEKSRTVEEAIAVAMAAADKNLKVHVFAAVKKANTIKGGAIK